MSGDNAKATDKKNTKYRGLSDKQKKILKAGGIAAASALSAYAAYKLADSDKLGDYGLKVAASIKRLAGDNKGSGDFINDIDDLSIASGFSKNSHPVSIAESCRKVNPLYNSGDKSYTNNCFSAVTADLLNRANNGKGLNVQARPATTQEIKNGGISFNKLLKPYSNSSIDDVIIKKGEINSAKQAAERELFERFGSEDSYGILRVKSSKNSSVGHFIKWEIIDGQVSFSDSLSGTMGADKYFTGMSNGIISRSFEVSKVSGLAVNPFEIAELVVSKK